MEGCYALFIAILGCDIKACDLIEGEELGMRRYPKSAEDAFKCYEGKDYTYESHFPDYYDIVEPKYEYPNHKRVMVA